MHLYFRGLHLIVEDIFEHRVEVAILDTIGEAPLELRSIGARCDIPEKILSNYFARLAAGDVTFRSVVLQDFSGCIQLDSSKCKDRKSVV